MSGFEPPNAGVSAAAWYSTHPRLQTSALWPYGSRMIISGAEYGIVPTAAFDSESRSPFASPDEATDRGPSAFASPKSTSFTRRASRSTKMLFGVMSRCTTPASLSK